MCRIYEYNQKIAATCCYYFTMYVSYGLVPAGGKSVWHCKLRCVISHTLNNSMEQRPS
jgi:hypothetical protein